jgi:hypothetical protein
MIECLHCKTMNTDKSVLCKGCGYPVAHGEHFSEKPRIYTEEERRQQRADELQRFNKLERKRNIRVGIIVVMLAINICGFVYGIMNQTSFSLKIYLFSELIAFVAFVNYCNPMLFFYWDVARYTSSPEKTRPSDSYLFFGKLMSIVMFVFATSIIYIIAIIGAKMFTE